MARRGDVRAQKPIAGQKLRPLLGQPGADLRTRLEPQILEDSSHVGGSRMLGDGELCGYLAAGESLRHQPEHLDLPSGQSRRISR